MMKTTKKLTVAVIMLLLANASYGQWTNLSTARLSVTNATQNLGVGTSWPQERLDIYGSGDNIQLRNYSETEAGLIMRDHDNQTTEFGKLLWNSGGDNEFDFYINDASTPKMTLNKDGDLGIGITAPQERLQVNGNAKIGDQWGNNVSLGAVTSSANFVSKYVGFNLSHDGTNWSVYNNSVNGASGILTKNTGKLLFVSVPTNVGTISDNTIAIDYSVMSIYQSSTEGRVVMGTANRDANLYVNGIAKAHRIEVLATVWSDFVFDDQYHLPSLMEVEEYIQKNNHLPDVPSEKEVMKKGIDLGEMDAILLQKIEELTLYTIEQQKIIDHLKNEVDELKVK